MAKPPLQTAVEPPHGAQLLKHDDGKTELRGSGRGGGTRCPRTDHDEVGRLVESGRRFGGRKPKRCESGKRCGARKGGRALEKLPSGRDGKRVGAFLVNPFERFAVGGHGCLLLFSFLWWSMAVYGDRAGAKRCGIARPILRVYARVVAGRSRVFYGRPRGRASRCKPKSHPIGTDFNALRLTAVCPTSKCLFRVFKGLFRTSLPPRVGSRVKTACGKIRGLGK